jgi:hypothetical protein
MDRVIGKHFSKIQVNNTTFDANGMRTWSEIMEIGTIEMLKEFHEQDTV